MGGTIAKLVDQGHDVLLLDMTNGEPTPHGDPETRAREAAAAAEILGVRRVLIDLPNRRVEPSIDARHRVAEVIRAVPPTGDPMNDTLAQCRAFLGCATMKNLNAVPIQEAITVLGWKRWRKLDASQTMGLLENALDRLRAQGQFQSHDPALLTDTVYGLLVNAMVTLSQSRNKKKTTEELMLLIEAFLRGAA